MGAGLTAAKLSPAAPVRVTGSVCFGLVGIGENVMDATTDELQDRYLDFARPMSCSPSLRRTLLAVPRPGSRSSGAAAAHVGVTLADPRSMVVPAENLSGRLAVLVPMISGRNAFRSACGLRTRSARSSGPYVP